MSDQTDSLRFIPVMAALSLLSEWVFPWRRFERTCRRHGPRSPL